MASVGLVRVLSAVMKETFLDFVWRLKNFFFSLKIHSFGFDILSLENMYLSLKGHILR